MLQHHDVLALTGGRHHQSLSRLAQREGGIVLSGEVRRRHPVDVVAEGSRSHSDRVLGFGAIFRAAFPQRGDVFVGQIHIVADVHGPKTSSGWGGPEQHCRKPISPLKGKEKEKAISRNEVNTMSKFPKAYSLTGEQVPAAKRQLWRARELTLLCVCTEVNWPCCKRKADKYDRLKQFWREANTVLFLPRVSTTFRTLCSVGEIWKILQQQAQDTHVLNHCGVKLEPNVPLISRSSASSSYLRLIVSNTKKSF